MKQLKIWIGIAISVLAVWFAIQGIQFDQIGDSFGKINWWWVIVSMIPYAIAIFFKVTRWQLLFKPSPNIRLHRLWATLMMSYLFNTVLPARLGEVVRAYALSRSEKIGPVRVLSTILLEKILDVMTMFIFLVALLPFLDIAEDVRRVALVTGGIVVVGFLVCMLMAAYRKKAEAFITFFLKWLPSGLRSKITGLANEVLDVLSILLDWRLSLNLWAQSFFQWTFVVLNYMMLGFAFNIPLTFDLALLLMIALNLAMVVPAAPGYIGTFELVVRTTLLPFFPGQASLLVSLGLLLHITGFLPVIVLGAYYTSREGLALNGVSKKDLKDTNSVAPTLTDKEPAPLKGS